MQLSNPLSRDSLQATRAHRGLDRATLIEPSFRIAVQISVSDPGPLHFLQLCDGSGMQLALHRRVERIQIPVGVAISSRQAYVHFQLCLRIIARIRNACLAKRALPQKEKAAEENIKKFGICPHRVLFANQLESEIENRFS